MARGRMINKEICADKKIHALSCDTSRLAFTWLVVFADREGRVRGDPALVRSMVFPRRDDVTIAEIEGYIQEWADCGLVVWYEANDDLWIWFQGFEKNQLGLRKEKEPASIIPPLTDDCRIIGGTSPDKVRLNGREENIIEDTSSLENSEETNLSDEELPSRTKITKKNRSPEEISVDNLVKYFARITRIPPEIDHKTRQKLWRNPLKRILLAKDGDEPLACKLIDLAITASEQASSNGDTQYPISSPNSIVKFAMNIHRDNSSHTGAVKLKF